MRDDRGRYTAPVPLTDSVPDWAAGCHDCTCGLVSPPDLTGAVSLYLERLVQAIDKHLVFCTCMAGERYRACLLNRRQELIEEARRNPMMLDAAKRLSHPDIDGARTKIAEAQALSVPSIHFEEKVYA